MSLDWYYFGLGVIGPLKAAGDPQSISVLDHYNFILLAPEKPDVRDDYLIPSGMGNFVASFASGLPISLQTSVDAVQWSGRNGVLLRTAAGTISARTVIITVPLGVLRSGQIAFDPALPSDYVIAMVGLPVGTFEKIALGFTQDVFGVGTNTEAFPFENQVDNAFILLKLWGTDVGVLLVGGSFAESLVAQGTQAMVTYGLETLEGMFGSSVIKFFDKALITSWLTDPFSLGSYTYALPQGVPGRSALSIPMGEQVFFAGEALSVKSFGTTVHGAYGSGVAAAQQVLHALAS